VVLRVGGSSPLTHPIHPPITPPSAATVCAEHQDATTPLTHGTPFERNQALRAWADTVALDPERPKAHIAYRVPNELFMNGMVAGTRSLPLHLREAFWWKFRPAAGPPLVGKAPRPTVA